MNCPTDESEGSASRSNIKRQKSSRPSKAQPNAVGAEALHSGSMVQFLLGGEVVGPTTLIR